MTYFAQNDVFFAKVRIIGRGLGECDVRFPGGKKCIGCVIIQMMKVVRNIVGVIFFGLVFFGAVWLRDYIQEVTIRFQVGKIKPGMSGKEVISILGKPTSRAISDIPGEYWCYGSSSWADPEIDSYCGNVSIEMSSVREEEAHVVKTPSVSDYWR